MNFCRSVYNISDSDFTKNILESIISKKYYFPEKDFSFYLQVKPGDTIRV